MRDVGRWATSVGSRIHLGHGLDEPSTSAALGSAAGGIEGPALRAIAQDGGAVRRAPRDSVARAVVFAVDAGGGVLSRDSLNRVASVALPVDGGSVVGDAAARCPEAVAAPRLVVCGDGGVGRAVADPVDAVEVEAIADDAGVLARVAV